MRSLDVLFEEVRPTQLCMDFMVDVVAQASFLFHIDKNSCLF